MSGKHIQIPVSQGGFMQAYVAVPEGTGPFPGLIVFQEAFGVNGHIRDVANRFAKEGYVAIAPELFHRTAPPGFEGNYADFASVTPHFTAVSENTIAEDSKACWDWLQSQSNVKSEAIACIGYCLGGRASFIANTTLPLRAAISYYGGRIVPDLIKKASALNAPMLFFWGGLDKHITPDQTAAVVDGMRKAGKKFVNVEISYADHAFFCDDRPNYNAEAAREAWALTLSFLKENIGV